MQRNSISMWRDGLLMHLLSKKMTLLLVNIQLYFSAGYILAIINSIYFSQCVHNFLCRRCRFWSMAETFPFFLEQVLFQRKAGRGRRYEENLLSSFPRSIFFLWAHFFPSLNNDKLRMLWEKAQNSSLKSYQLHKTPTHITRVLAIPRALSLGIWSSKCLILGKLSHFLKTCTAHTYALFIMYMKKGTHNSPIYHECQTQSAKVLALSQKQVL